MKASEFIVLTDRDDGTRHAIRVDQIVSVAETSNGTFVDLASYTVKQTAEDGSALRHPFGIPAKESFETIMKYLDHKLAI